ncbi:MAG: hypothetical protein V3S46_06130 [Nitrospinota bacterium]
MKIDGISPTGKGGDASAKKTEKAAGKPFDSYLKESMGAGKAASAGAPGMPHPVAPVPGIEQTSGAIKTQAARLMENALDDLEFYRNTLSNAEVPVARLLPMTEELMRKKDSLVSILGHVDDPELHNLISQTAALIINENSRYHST